MVALQNMGKDFIPFIRAVGRGDKLKRDLTYDEAREAMRLLLTGGASEAQAGAFLLTQRVKGESADEVRAFTDTIRAEFATRLAPNVENLIDLATPYNGKTRTAQLAPAIACVLVAAGFPVLLHGGDDVPTKSGVTVKHVLAGLGLSVELSPAEASRQLEQRGIAYIDMRHFAPEYDKLTALRREFGLRTVFNTVEKFLNPANAPYQFSGFFHANYVERIRATQTGSALSYIIQGEEGSIEMAAGRRTRIFGTDKTDDLTLDPSAVGLPARERIEVAPKIADHVAINCSVLNGERGAAADQVAFSAGTMLHLLGAEESVTRGFERAYRLLTSGEVTRTLR